MKKTSFEGKGAELIKKNRDLAEKLPHAVEDVAYYKGKLRAKREARCALGT